MQLAWKRGGHAFFWLYRKLIDFHSYIQMQNNFTNYRRSSTKTMNTNNNKRFATVDLYEFERTNEPNVYFDSSTGKYHIKVLVHSNKANNSPGSIKKSRGYSTREEAKAVSSDFRVDLETRRLHNKDPERVWKGGSNHNPVVAKNSTAMNQINETAYKKTKLEDANLAIDRNEWVNLVYSSSKEKEGRATFIILRSIRRANYNRRWRMGISTGYYIIKPKFILKISKTRFISVVRIALLT